MKRIGELDRPGCLPRQPAQNLGQLAQRGGRQARQANVMQALGRQIRVQLPQQAGRGVGAADEHHQRLHRPVHEVFQQREHPGGQALGAVQNQQQRLVAGHHHRPQPHQQRLGVTGLLQRAAQLGL